MQIQSKVFFAYAVAGQWLVDALLLRAKQNGNVLSIEAHDDIQYEVLEKKSIKRESTLDCMCKLGSFWHWRIKDCVEQGAWGYECGFFPAEHHDKVCQDKLKCELLDQTRHDYFHPGAAPGSCKKCDANDNCLTGEKRHSDTCLKEYKLSGDACQTVQVTVTATASAEVKEKVTKTATA